MSTPLLEFIGVEKVFFGVRVLRGITFAVQPGSITGLVGENGAGKSTLMNILGGNLRPDSGGMRYAGEPHAPADPQAAARRGIAFIHQELNLFPNLTIAENLFLTRFPVGSPLPLIKRRDCRERAMVLLREAGLDVSPDRLVETLTAGERQLVEVAKALAIDARLIIFDEPTTSLSTREAEHLFALIHQLRARGIAMIYISHALADVFRLCDQLVVLRDGEVAGAGPVEGFNVEKLVSLMVGRPMSQLFPMRSKQPGREPLLEVRGLKRRGVEGEISFSLHAGEVLGLAGMMGAGRSEFARVLFGLDARERGEVCLSGETLHHLSPRDLIERGVAFLTENRRTEGLCLDAPVAENLGLATLPEHGRGPFRWLGRDALAAAVTRIREVIRLDAKTSDTQAVRTLSGGNQQKVVLGKWLLRSPRVLLLDEPTRGIDVGAKFELYKLILQLADDGAGILIISSEMEELMGLCDRMLVMKTGQLVDELPRAEFQRERILAAALGTSSRIKEAL